MRVIIYTTCFSTPHLETELEIYSKLIEDKNEVFFLICNKDLKTCYSNPFHKNSICQLCITKVTNGIKLLNVDHQNIIFLKSHFENNINLPDSIDDLRRIKYKNINIGNGIFSSIVSITRDHSFKIENNIQLIKSSINTSVVIIENILSVIEKYKPDAFVFFNGRFLETKPVIDICKLYNIDFYTHERGGIVNNYLFRKNSTPHDIGFIKNEINNLWENSNEDKLIIGRKFFTDRREKVVQSWVVFTENQKKGTLPINFNKNKINITIFNSSIDEYESIDEYHENVIFNNEFEGIVYLCNFLLQYPNYHIYLRVHPNLKDLNNTQNFELKSLKNKFSNLTIIDANDVIDSYTLLDNSDIVITYCSTVGIESLFYKKKTILLGRSIYEDAKGLLIPRTKQEFQDFIFKEYVPETNIDAIKFGYWFLTFGHKHENYKPIDLFHGKFNGIIIRPNIFKLLLYKVDRLICLIRQLFS